MSLRRADTPRSRRSPRSTVEYQRESIRQTAARIMAEQGLRDFHNAKLKACERLGVSTKKASLPTNKEIEQALVAHLRLFESGSVYDRSRRLLVVAVELMEKLTCFEPRLVGALIRGNVTPRTPVEIHVFADTNEEVSSHLTSCAIPHDPFDKRFRMNLHRYERLPAFRFVVGDVAVELVAFSTIGIRQAPLCPVEGRPMTRARLPKVRDMLATA